VETSSRKTLLYFGNFQKLLKVKTRPKGENSPNFSPNLVTLLSVALLKACSGSRQ
jgi:hypothetical protein